MHGADDIVRELISHGANVNVKSETGDENTPLAAAIVAGHPSTVESLLINGANPDFNSSWETSVSVAARYGRHECMDLLLKHGGSLETLDDLPSLLEYASASGSAETVKSLLAQGLNVHEKNCLMHVPMDKMLPAYTYTFEYPTIYISESEPHVQVIWPRYGSPMHAAAAYGHTEVIKLLVENNAAVNERSHYWETPSTLARLRGHETTLEYLMSKGGVALEQTKVCYRQDLFKGSGISNGRLRYCGFYDNDGDDYVEGDDDLNGCSEE